TPWGENTPMWMVSPDCSNFIREMSRLRWAGYESDKKSYEMNKKEEVHKKDDHSFDSAKYFATLMPDLRPSSQEIFEKAPVHLSFTQMMTVLNNDPDVVMLNETWDTQEVNDFDDLERIW